MVCLFEYSLGMEKQALEHIESQIAQAPGEADLHEMRALILCDLGRFDEARVAMRRALGAAPLHPEFHQSMGLIERMSGKPEAALPHLLTMAVACPNEVRALAELAVCFVQLGRLEEARTGFANMPASAATSPFVAYARAAMDAATGDEVRAGRDLRAATERRPELASRASFDPAMLTVVALGLQPAAQAGAESS
jgi:Flp pilus assembly protein TadD